MQNKILHIVGVMSGTSLDGIDLVAIQFDHQFGKWHYKVGVAETIAYTDEWIVKLQQAVHYSEVDLAQLNQDYTALLGNVIRSFISKNSLENIDAVCSHGHTVLHQPKEGYTLQIGNLPRISQYVQQKVVCDFRVQDVAMGGQGAPLVPIGDALLFSEYDYCLNLGGFSNISFDNNGQRVAFDISPVNTVLNFAAQQLGFLYDDKGKIAQSGNIHPSLLEELNALDYYQKSFPKSLGVEFVHQIIFPIIQKYVPNTADLLHTFCHHIAQQIALALPQSSGKMLVTGGGAFNIFLIELIQYYAPNIVLVVPNNSTVNFKEALIFGFLGVLRLQEQNNVLASVTGAPHNHCAGFIYEP